MYQFSESYRRVCSNQHEGVNKKAFARKREVEGIYSALVKGGLRTAIE